MIVCFPGTFFLSDLLDVQVDRPVINETTALGAAYLAGLAVGFWQSRNEISENWKNDKSFQPDMDEETRGQLYDGWKKAVESAMVFK